MKILVPVDGSAFSEMAIDFLIRRASALAEPPVVELLFVQAPLPVVARRALGKEARARFYEGAADAVLLPLIRRLERAGMTSRRRTETGVPAERIAGRADQLGVDLVLMGSHGRSAIPEMVLGSVTQGVLARSRRPMLVLRGDRSTSERALRVGVALDGSRPSKAALAAVLRGDRVLGAVKRLDLIHVQPPPQVFMEPITAMALPAGIDPDPALTERILAPARRMANKAGYESRDVVLRGWAGDALAAYARKNLDVLAIGATGRTRLSRWFLGSVAAQVAARCEVPLLLAHE